MLPENNSIINNEVSLPNRTYNINIDSKHIAGHIDSKEAIVQAIYIMLSTEKYESLIFDWSFGIETQSLIGKNKDFVEAELKRMIQDCLLKDDRIESISDLYLEYNDQIISIQFLVQSSVGEVDIKWEVKI